MDRGCASDEEKGTRWERNERETGSGRQRVARSVVSRTHVAKTWKESDSAHSRKLTCPVMAL